MDTKKKIDEKIDELNNNFDKLILNDKLNIGSLEEILLDNIEDYKKIINHHAEDLLSNKIDEKKLVSKKNKNGKSWDMN